MPTESQGRTGWRSKVPLHGKLTAITYPVIRMPIQNGLPAMNVIFGLHPALMLAVFVLFGVISYLVALGCLALFGRGKPVPAAWMPVPNFAATITTAWALALGFAAADIWSVNSQARQAAAEERSAITRIAGIAVPGMLDRPALVASILAYKDAVQDEEWNGHANRAPAPEADAAIEEIRAEIVRLAFDGTPDALVAKIAEDFDQLQDARSSRLAIGQGPGGDYKWYLVLFLTVLSQVALASVHADRWIGGRRSLVIFTTAAVVSLWILALHANPYVGVASISFAEIRGLPVLGSVIY
jgi:hypothetical protein